MPPPSIVQRWLDEPERAGLTDPNAAVSLKSVATDAGLRDAVRVCQGTITADEAESQHHFARATAGYAALLSVSRLFLARGITEFKIADVEKQVWLDGSAARPPKHSVDHIWAQYHYVASIADEARLWLIAGAQQGRQPLDLLTGEYESQRDATNRVRERLSKLINVVDHLVPSLGSRT